MPPARRAFTLLELLIVIGIIALLVALTFMVGAAVTSNSKKGLTQDTLRVLDGALAAYIADRGELPPAFLDDPRQSGANRVIPIADARNTDLPDPAGAPQDSTIVSSVALFVTQCQQVPDAKALLDRLPAKVAVQIPVTVGTGNPATVQMTTVLDGWGRPIRYVHPAFSVDYPATSTDLLLAPPAGKTWTIANLRRSHGVAADPRSGNPNPSAFPDADGGRCPGGRPYFYSAGEDGLVGHVEDGPDFDKDNVYTVAPTKPVN
jgi:prepilin-type N-terminal cleavage/methylation domain-containing protein